MSINGIKAASALRGYAPLSRRGACLYYVWLAYRSQGATSDRVYPTAYSAWLTTRYRHNDKTPPAGFPVWLGKRHDGNLDGDVAISAGNGRIIASDYPTWGQVGECSIDDRIRQTGREYLGWTEDFLGNIISYESPTNITIPGQFQPLLEDDEMTRNFISLNATAPKFELGLNSKRSVSQAEWTAIRAIESAGGPKVIVAFVSQTILDAIPGK